MTSEEKRRRLIFFTGRFDNTAKQQSRHSSSRSSRRTTRGARFAIMLPRTSILLLVAACVAVAAQPDLPPAEVAPAPQTAELPLPDTPYVVAADPPRRRRAATDRDDGDAFAPGPGPSLAETPLNCSSIEGVTGNMPGVDLFYERASRQVERSHKKTRSVWIFSLSSFASVRFRHR